MINWQTNLNRLNVKKEEFCMEIKEQISSFKAMVNSYKLTNLIIASNNIGLFNVLGEESKSLKEISKELKVSKNKIEPILNGLVFNKIISKNQKGYFLDEYKNVLLNSSEFNQTGYINFAQSLVTKYQKLENAIKDTDFAEKKFKELTEEDAENFMQGMSANGIPQAKFVAENYDFDNHKILDIGAGAGTYLITVAQKYGNVTGKMIDLPQVSKIQNKNIIKENLQERLVSIECDYNISFPSEIYDDVFLFAVVHQEPQENVEKLLKNIFNVLKPNGRLFLTSFFLNDDKISPEFSVQFAIEMLLNSKNGKVYTHSEIENIIKKCGYKKYDRVNNIPSPATLYVIKK